MVRQHVLFLLLFVDFVVNCLLIYQSEYWYSRVFI